MPMLALVGPILSKVKLFGAHLGPRLGQVGPMWFVLGTSWAHVEPMLAYVRPIWVRPFWDRGSAAGGAPVYPARGPRGPAMAVSLT